MKRQYLYAHHKKVVVLFIMIILVLPIVFSQSAFWKETALRLNFDRSSLGFCSKSTQCLVNRDFNASLDDTISAFYTGILPSQKPMCIENEQYVLDFYCDNSFWTTRSKFIALQLLDFAEEKNINDFVLFCDNVNNAVNDINYVVNNNRVFELVSNTCNPFDSLSSYPCVNNFCVLQYGTKVAFGTSVNTRINGPASFLKSLGVSTSACDNVIASTFFAECAQSPVGAKLFYNSKLESVIYVPIDTISSFSITLLFDKYILTPFKKIFGYAQKTKPTDTSLHQLLNESTLYDNIYIGKKGQKTIFAFMERQVSLPKMDYIGIIFQNINLGADPCFTFLKSVDQSVVCEAQTPGEFYVVHSKTSSLINLWKDLTAKLRPE